MDEEWISAGEAYGAVQAYYEKNDRDAHQGEYAIIQRLKSGVLRARAATYKFTRDPNTPFDDPELISLVPETDVIPPYFWQCYDFAGYNRRTEDWLSGDFTFRFFEENNAEIFGEVYDVIFTRRGLPGLGSSLIHPPVAAETQIVRGRGRSSALWWPDFAEELALFIYEEGLPEGAGAEGQSQVINGVFGRMAERGVGEPSRTSVQPVISAVLQRARLAGK